MNRFGNDSVGYFIATHKVGSGSFGEAYRVIDEKTHQEYVAKLESIYLAPSQVQIEIKVFQSLNDSLGFPKMIWNGREGEKSILVMEHAGKSIESIFVSMNKKFSLKTVLMLADQMISRIQFLHSKSFIHRDIKPENFLFKKIVSLVDFGLAKQYRTPKGHVPYRNQKNLVGTMRYASLSTHLGIEQSRRDDLESLIYILIYLLKGSLPWSSKGVDQVYAIKRDTSIEDLCSGLPTEFADLLHLIRKLDFQEDPDYGLYRQCLRNLFMRQGFVFDSRYDWQTSQQ